MIKTGDDGTATMRNVKIHDVYVDDPGGEGIYLGSTQAQPQHSFQDLDLRYKATATNSQMRPDQHPEVWAPLPPPADDARLASTSPYQGLGLQ